MKTQQITALWTLLTSMQELSPEDLQCGELNTNITKILRLVLLLNMIVVVLVVCCFIWHFSFSTYQ